MVLPDSSRVPRVPLYSGTRSTTPPRISHTGLLPSLARLSSHVLLSACAREESAASSDPAPRPHPCNACRLTHGWFRLFPFRSPLLRESLLLSLPEGTEMCQFPSFASLSGCRGMTLGGFPHSEILGSKRAPAPRGLSQNCHVLHRLPAPRHPPYALRSLTTVTSTPKRMSSTVPCGSHGAFVFIKRTSFPIRFSYQGAIGWSPIGWWS